MIQYYHHHAVHYIPRSYLSYTWKFAYFFTTFFYSFYFDHISLSNHSFNNCPSRTSSVPGIVLGNKIYILVEKTYTDHTIGQTHNNNNIYNIYLNYDLRYQRKAQRAVLDSDAVIVEDLPWGNDTWVEVWTTSQVNSVKGGGEQKRI